MFADPPERGIQYARVVRVYYEVNRAGAFVMEKYLRPRLPAIAGAVDAALRVWAEAMPEGRDVDSFRVSGMHNDAGDIVRRFKAAVPPCLAAILSHIHTVATGDIARQAALPGANIDDIRRAWGNGNRTHRTTAECAVTERSPRRAAIVCPPDPAAACPAIKRFRVCWMPADRHHAPPTPRAETSPAQTIKRGI